MRLFLLLISLSLRLGAVCILPFSAPALAQPLPSDGRSRLIFPVPRRPIKGREPWRRFSGNGAASPGSSAGRQPALHSSPPPLCSPLATAKVFPVLKQSDFLRRLTVPPTQTVILRLLRDVLLSSPLLFNASFSCSIVTNRDSQAPPASIVYAGWDGPLLAVLQASNILLLRVNLMNVGATDKAPDCTLYHFGSPCPALFVFQAWSVQVTKALVYGQVHIARSIFCRLDSLTITAPQPAVPGRPVNPHWLGDGLVFLQQSGVGISRPIIKSENVLSNSNVYGAHILVSLTGCSVGNTISNNFLHSFGFAAVRCGNYVHFLMDCHENVFLRNYVFRTPKGADQPLGDSGAFYFTTKWFNPGNRLVCNYVTGGDYCYYLDFAASGISIDGGVCAHSKGAVVKLNTGKWTHIRSLIIVGPAPPQLMSCICTPWFNCTTDPGVYYEHLRQRFYNDSSINQKYPALQTVCEPSRQESLDGKACNPPGSTPATCAALPYHNDNEYIVLDRSADFDIIGFCGDRPAVRDLNRLKLYNFTLAEARFAGDGDYGVQQDSAIPKRVPGFYNCSLSTLGPKEVKVSEYFDRWNMAQPMSYSLVVTAIYCFGYTCGNGGTVSYINVPNSAEFAASMYS